jgi:histidinol dehydrogenase
MQKILYPTSQSWAIYTQRGGQNYRNLHEIVLPILQDLKTQGDKALRHYVQKFDKVQIEDFRVSEAEFQEAQNLVHDDLKKAIQTAKYNIAKFHLEQHEHPKKVETMEGVSCWRKSVAIQRVGLYIPSQSAPMFSTILMLGIPANMAGCEKIILCTSPQSNGKIHPALLYTAQLLNIKNVFKCGGVQAIGAMAYGTESIPKVDKIFGPSNQYVTTAKQLVAEEGTAIDMPAGPSEVLVIADQNANAVFVASDLLSQAEHGESSQVILATNSEKFADEVLAQIEIQTQTQPRKEIILKALAHSRILVFENITEAMDFSNEYAPEHLILHVDNPEILADKVKNAGSVFLGAYSPESVGDYASGTNHTLPTEGFAKAYSGVSLDSFLKKITFQKISEKGLQNIGKTVETMAEAEGFFAHKNAVTVRLNFLNH